MTLANTPAASSYRNRDGRHQHQTRRVPWPSRPRPDACRHSPAFLLRSARLELNTKIVLRDGCYRGIVFTVTARLIRAAAEIDESTGWVAISTLTPSGDTTYCRLQQPKHLAQITPARHSGRHPRARRKARSRSPPRRNRCDLPRRSEQTSDVGTPASPTTVERIKR